MPRLSDHWVQGVFVAIYLVLALFFGCWHLEKVPPVLRNDTVFDLRQALRVAGGARYDRAETCAACKQSFPTAEGFFFPIPGVEYEEN